VSYTKYVMRGDGVFAIISKMTGVEHSTLSWFIGSPTGVKTAGFLYLNQDKELQSYGQSNSLGLKSEESDGVEIARALEEGRVTVVEHEDAGFFYATNDPNAVGEPSVTLEALQSHRILERDD